MTDKLYGLVNEAKNNRFSTLDQDLSDADVASVWENVSAFIEKQMNLQKGVTIPGLGTFTFSQKKLDVGNNKFVLIQRPIFQLSEKFAQTLDLTYTKHYTTGQVPVVPLNYASLSMESPFNRDTVETCVREVIGAISRSINAKKNIEFTFSGIGRLQIRDRKVKMKFYKEFLNAMDGSGKLTDALRNRPGTGDSVMSNRSPSRPYSVNTLVLPKILGELEANNQFMPTINEEDGPVSKAPKKEADHNEIGSDPAGDRLVVEDVMEEDTAGQEVNMDVGAAEGGEVDKLFDSELQQILDELDTTEYKEAPVPGEGEIKELPATANSRQGSRLAIPMAMASGIFADDLKAPATGRLSALSKSSPAPLNSLSPNLPHSAHTPRLAPIDPLLLNSARSKSADGIKILTPSRPSPPKLEDLKAPETPCGHKDAGQELCYLCHQREQKNIPVFFNDERQKREHEEDRLLQQYQQLRDTENLLREQEHYLARRHEQQKIAAFNLGITEAVRTKKTAKPTDFHPSFIFKTRPLTPPRIYRQKAYSEDLEMQMKAKEDVILKQKSDDAFLERLEQVQLAEDLAAQREQYIKDKTDQTQQYKKALSAQVRFKPLQLPARVPDSSEPVFGRHDMTNQGLFEKRRRNFELFRDQQMTVEQRKREALLRRLNEQKEEEDMLKRTKDNLLSDRAKRHERTHQNRKKLEEDWSSAANVKHQRDLDDRQFRGQGANLLLDQLSQHDRCGQCKKKLPNCGESNIWRESRYIPGSRIMV